VKWYSPEKGFGFVSLDDSSGDAFLHASLLEQSVRDPAALKAGVVLRVRVGNGLKGPQVTEILDVDESAAAISRTPSPVRQAEPLQHDSGATRMTGTVKWYSVERGFGFVAVDDGRNEVFVHATTLQRSRLTRLSEGQRVALQVKKGRRGLEAIAISAGD
jgi:CspA family cold shock protein